MALHIDVISDVICPGCFIGKRRLERKVLDEAHVLAVGKVHAVAATHHGVTKRLPRKTDARRKIIAIWIDQRLRIMSRVWARATGQH